MFDRRIVLLSWCLLPFAAAQVHAGQPLETESARLLKRGVFDLAAGFEHQFVRQVQGGTEVALNQHLPRRVHRGVDVPRFMPGVISSVVVRNWIHG